MRAMRESALLERIFGLTRDLKSRDADVAITLPPGDDMAALDIAGTPVLVAVDQVIEGRHVVPETDARAIGAKAINRCVSDVAAMAGMPVASLAAAALPLDETRWGRERVDALLAGLVDAANRAGAPLIGGDLASVPASAPLVLSVTVLARPGPAGVITRHGARPGDVVAVTGCIGGSMLPDGGGRHLTFQPRVDAALDLARRIGDRLHAMIDVSDGLGRDLGHVARASRVRIEIDPARIPCTPGRAWRDAIGDGEDYELVVVAAPPLPPRIGPGAGVSLTVIGRVCAPGPGGAEVVASVDADSARDGNESGWRALDATGWEHGVP